MPAGAWASGVASHRLAAAAAVLVGLSLAWKIARHVVSASVAKHAVLRALRRVPLLRLSDPPEGLSGADLTLMTGMYAFICCFYASFCDPDGRPNARGPGALPIVRYRLEVLLLSLPAQTVLYYAAAHALRGRLRDERQLEQQAANVVRVLVKCLLMVFLAIYGNWWHISFAPAERLGENDFAVAYIGAAGMSCLYVWELLFRQLRPVSYIHHGAALMGAWASVEMFGDDTPGQATRKFLVNGTVMSFTEGWCCLAVFLGALQCCSLRQRAQLMKLNYIAGGIVYNFIAVWWAATIWMNWDAMPPAQRTMGAPSILLLTYPAQMYMIWTFRQMARRFAKRAREVEAEARAGAAAPGAPRAGAVAAAKEGPLARRRPPTGPSAAPPDKIQVARGGAPGVDMP